MHVLVRADHEHHHRLLTETDRMPTLGDMFGHAPIDEIRAYLDEMLPFLSNVLLPHIAAREAALYPELERLLQDRHVMASMSREHTEIRNLVGRLCLARQRLAELYTVGVGEAAELRRLIFRLYALLKVHMAEEELYTDILDHHLPDERAEELGAALRQARSVDL
jgi:hypothetical protein